MRDRDVIEYTVRAVIRRLKRDGGNGVGTITWDGARWAAFGRSLSEDQMEKYVRVLAERWWSKEGLNEVPTMSAVLGVA